mmetsp:Transcript_3586/g.7416  ORF Transcript_3586/g.7416 Transcript_3586/m.7416 type:complete len:216 (+) Transcript_3586:2159-2806(+)
MNSQKNPIPASVSSLIKTVIRTFYSDLHIQVIEVIIRVGYTSEYTISKELEIKIEKVKLVTNSLYNENFVKFEDRIFKKQKERKKDFTHKIYKIKFWFIDSNSFIWNLKERIRKFFLNQKHLNRDRGVIIFKCPRKICGKKFSAVEIAGIPFDHLNGILTCNNYLNQKIICGTELIENKEYDSNSIQLKKTIKGGGTVQEINPIVETLLFSIKFL